MRRRSQPTQRDAGDEDEGTTLETSSNCKATARRVRGSERGFEEAYRGQREAITREWSV